MKMQARDLFTVVTAGVLLFGSSCASRNLAKNDQPADAAVEAALADQSEQAEAEGKKKSLLSFGKREEVKHSDPFLAQAATKPAETPQADPTSDVEVVRVAQAEPRQEMALQPSKPAAPEVPASANPFATEEVQTASAGTVNPFATDGVKTVSAETMNPFATQADRPVAISHESMAREPVDHPAYCPPVGPVENCPPNGCPPATGIVCSTARPFPEYVGDEYICDGGDKGLPVHYNGTQRMGLDTEDTVAEFMDHTGEQHVKASNKTCVYAPRFASVRTSTGAQLDFNIDKALGHQDQAAVVGLDTMQSLDEKVQRDEAVGMQMRERSSGIEGNAYDGLLAKAVSAKKHVKLIGASEDFQFFRDGMFAKVNPAVIGVMIDAAFDWTGDRGVRIMAVDLNGQEVNGRFTAQDFTGVEDRRTPGDLRIVKVADRNLAKPGDIVTFTIRFDNIGDRELLGVRVLDNLSPRLEFIEGTVDSDLDGKLTVEDNTAGGQLLIFDFEQGLAGQSGGYVSFQTRVR